MRLLSLGIVLGLVILLFDFKSTEIMEDLRNFRNSYYERVGCRSVEEKKSLEILFKENPVNIGKLFQFLKMFSVTNN